MLFFPTTRTFTVLYQKGIWRKPLAVPDIHIISIVQHISEATHGN